MIASRQITPLMTLRYRVMQAVAFFVARPGRYSLPPDLAIRLRSNTALIFRALPPTDQGHLIAVSRQLRDLGASEELVIAGLLHDIGKSVDGKGVPFFSRCLKVGLAVVAPTLLTRVQTHQSPPRGLRGLWVACNHARIGAQIARDLGYGDRICWLIANHEDSHADDAELRKLIEVDQSPWSVPSPYLMRQVP